MQTAVRITNVFVITDLLLYHLSKTIQVLPYINLVSDHCLTPLSAASVRGTLVLGIGRNLILQVLIVVRII